ncbi:MAG TPA: GAD-like domain-containing protein [Ideonella sp.]|uniref:GAD-like domain-containing protein n=1 Tax=Ideonella sp. TaxID=1929293 RepID=UPI002BBBD81B|nr:GAD-like domain-containing protein [Ideonella sp.]HSI51620.1 GAD-like domain-containing protein [Ideonella sp.]
MDENFEYFLEKIGPAFDRRYVPPSTIDRYRGRLPNQLLSYWDEHGWCGYADGLFWTVDPGEYEPALQAWIGDTPFMEADAYHVIARSAFGKLYLCGEKTGCTLVVSAVGAYAVPQPQSEALPDKHIQMFFGTRKREVNDFADYFAPALALGGPSKFESLEKLKAVEHLVFLAQLSELEVLTAPPR